MKNQTKRVFGWMKDHLFQKLPSNTNLSLCEETSNVTKRIRTLLNITYKSLSLCDRSDNPKIKRIIFLLENWLFSITTDHDISEYVEATVSRNIRKYPDYVGCAVFKLYSKENTISSLMYKHLLFSKVTQEEIYPSDSFSELCLMVTITLNPNIRFGPMSCFKIFEGLDEQHYINHLRQNRSAVHEYGNLLANRKDETDFRLDRDHALISSVSLVYVFSLVYVILKYESYLHSEPVISNILQIILTTLHELKRGFTNDENYWQ